MVRECYHEIETSHEQDQVDEQEPVLSQCNAGFGHEGACDTVTLFPERITFSIRFGFRQAQAEDDDQHWRACAKPEKWSPSVGSCVNQTTSEDHCQEVPKCIALLQHSRDNTSKAWSVCQSSPLLKSQHTSLVQDNLQARSLPHCHISLPLQRQKEPCRQGTAYRCCRSRCRVLEQ